MVEQMTNEELLDIEEKDVFYVRFRLSNIEIEQWKKDGKFKHLKEELLRIPNIKFGCLEQPSGYCVYNFILPTLPLMSRTTRLISALMSGKKPHIFQVPNTEYFTSPSSGAFSGTPKVCNLF